MENKNLLACCRCRRLVPKMDSKNGKCRSCNEGLPKIVFKEGAALPKKKIYPNPTRKIAKIPAPPSSVKPKINDHERYRYFFMNRLKFNSVNINDSVKFEEIDSHRWISIQTRRYLKMDFEKYLTEGLFIITPVANWIIKDYGEVTIIFHAHHRNAGWHIHRKDYPHQRCEISYYVANIIDHDWMYSIAENDEKRSYEENILYLDLLRFYI